MGQYPFEWQAQKICTADFIHFYSQFSNTILELIPFADGPVTFFDPTVDLRSSLLEKSKPKYWQRYIRHATKRQRSILASERPVLFMPVWDAASLICIAAVEGIEEQFAGTISGEWLSDRSRIISREFLLHKQLALDPVTGMFNGRHFHDALDHLLGLCIKKSGFQGPIAAPKHISLLLIEIHPRGNNAAKTLKYIARAGYYLESLLGQDVLHHLGNGVFGVVCQGVDDEQARKLGKNILSWFRREGFYRIHIGINSLDTESYFSSDEAEMSMVHKTVVAQTWMSLSRANQRGPYALCAYSSISNPDAHPLKKIEPSLAKKFRKLWTDSSSFAVMLVSQDKETGDETFSRRLMALVGPSAEGIPLNSSETYIFLDNADKKKALSWAGKLKEKLPVASGATYLIGVACFPCIDFKKSDVVQNARKALLHAGFFGPGTITFFDSISQNVSGDIYYSEGDLVQAVKEYRKGLEMDPENLNLLNSLGETYAQMNKPRKAKPYFEAVLQNDSGHYMALFNLGMTCSSIGEDEKAIPYFEKALAVYRRSKPEKYQPNDLLLQLSKLYCRTGRYKKAVTLLEKEKITAQSGQDFPARYVLLRFLGEAYLEVGRNNEAIRVLQQAIRYNPHDAHALSILGQLYALENEGDDIAVSLCEQAVNIDDRQWKHWYRLAEVKYKQTFYEEALAAVKESLRLERKKAKIYYLAGQVYDKMGAKSKAAAMYKGALRIEPGHKPAAAALKKINKRNI